MSGLGNPMEPAGEGAQPAENEPPSAGDGVSSERPVDAEPVVEPVNEPPVDPGAETSVGAGPAEPEPPSADGPTAGGSAAEPSVAEPSIAEAPVTDAAADGQAAVEADVEPEIVQPEPAQPEADKTEPPATESITAEPPATESITAEPEPAESTAAEPSISEPSADESSDVEAPVSDSAGAPDEAAAASVEAPTEPATPPKVGDAKAPGDAKLAPDEKASPSGAPAGSAPTSAPPAGTPPVAGGPKARSATETGKIVEGLVTAVSVESVELTLDDGRPAVIHRRNFGLNDEEPSAVLSIGDRAFGAELAREDPKARVVLSRAWALKRQAWEKVVNAAKEGQYLSGRVMSASKKGLVVDVGVRGFVPSSHLELEAVPDMSTYIDQVLELKILEVDPRREKLVLSRRSLLLKAQRKEIQTLLQSLKPGEVRTGKVASLADYGAFVDLGGVSGLVHISELSWHRVTKPADVLSVGQQVEVKVLDVKPKKKRISLSIRQTAPDPLTSIEIGAIVTGAVTRLVDFGAFVAIDGFEGLVHLSELAEYRVSTPEEIVTPGDQVGVKILSVDVKRRRIELSIRRAAEYQG